MGAGAERRGALARNCHFRICVRLEFAQASSYCFYDQEKQYREMISLRVKTLGRNESFQKTISGKPCTISGKLLLLRSC